MHISNNQAKLLTENCFFSFFYGFSLIALEEIVFEIFEKNSSKSMF